MAPSNSEVEEDIRPFAALPRYPEHYVDHIEFSPDDRFLATGSNDAIGVRLWEQLTGRHIREFKVIGSVRSLSFSPSGRQLAAISHEIKTETAYLYMWDIGKVAGDEGAEVKMEYKKVDLGSHVVSFSSDGNLIAVMLPNRIMVQGVYDGRLVTEITNSTGRRFEPLLGWSSSDRKLFFAYSESDSYKVACLDVGSRQPSQVTISLAQDNLKSPEKSPISSLTCSRDGNILAAALPEGGIRIWDAATGKALHDRLVGHLDNVSCVSFSPDGVWVMDGSKDKALRVWDILTGKPALAPLRHWAQQQIKAVACSPDRRHVACIDRANHVHIWDVQAQKLVLSSVANYNVNKGPSFTHYPQGDVDAIQWFPDARRFVSSGSSDDYIRVWDDQTGEEVYNFHYYGGPRIGLSPDGGLLAVGPSREATRPVVLLNASSGEEYTPSLVDTGGHVRKLAFSPDSSTLAILFRTPQGTNLHLVHDVTGLRKVNVVPQRAFDVVFSPDGEHFAYVTAQEYPTWLGHTICLCRLDTMEVTARLQTRKKSANTHCLSFSADGRRLLDASDKGDTAVWDLDTGQKLFDIPVEDQRRHLASFSPDGRSILSGWWVTKQRAGVDLFDAVAGTRIWRIEEKQVPTALSFTPGGDRLAMGFNDGSLRLYESSTRKLILPKSEKTEEKPADGRASPSGAKNAPGASKRQQGTRAIPSGLADTDDESIMNMPAALGGAARRRAEASSAGQTASTRKQPPRKNDLHPQPGLITRLVSRFMPRSSSSGRRWIRPIRLVSVGRARERNLAGASPDAAGSRSRRRQNSQEDDDSSTSPSPPQSDRAVSPRTGHGDGESGASSDSGFCDVIRYCLCITCC
ncbi:WD40 repeat-like protein [Coniophora puteana RWD-64-598 SS2]|uniref:WD40 repeat-like protein n=1 Tax=Coniophora puteana (strain RWD-64-598) TaxID=741705 RepID=A0A5M3N1Q8_CONPW|nr:WD40 repeat-like protein [Coniophora puteana RWD-64-598 SS2]EIW84811.1 WD40 repeat-like protein [Coniophora puteana RWD-64-598 SS2]